MIGARAVTLLIADFSGRSLVRLTSDRPVAGARRRGRQEQAETLPLARHALRPGAADPARRCPAAGGRRPDDGSGDRPRRRDRPARAGPAPPPLARGGRRHRRRGARPRLRRHRRPRHTDVFEWGQRTTVFALAAEIQRRLLPASYTCEAGQFTLAGWLEPASSVGGDTFDYTLDRDSLQISITDAVGHQVAAALLPPSSSGALRNGRRKGLDLAEQARYANDSLADNAPPGQFVTGQLMRVDLHTGTASIVNAGHPFPLRLRGGKVEEVELRDRGALRRSPAQALRRPGFPSRAGRPDRPAHRRHAGAQRRQPGCGGSARRHRRSPSRARSSTRWVPRCSTPPAATCATTRRWSASTGTAARPRGRTSEQGADPARASAAAPPARRN